MCCYPVLFLTPGSRSRARKFLADVRPLIVDTGDAAGIAAFNTQISEAEASWDMTPEALAVQGLANVPPVEPIDLLSAEGGRIAL